MKFSSKHPVILHLLGMFAADDHFKLRLDPHNEVTSWIKCQNYFDFILVTLGSISSDSACFPPPSSWACAETATLIHCGLKRFPPQSCQVQRPLLHRWRLPVMKDASPRSINPSTLKSTAWTAASASQHFRIWKDEDARSRRRLCSNSWRDWSQTRPTGQERAETRIRSSVNSSLVRGSVRINSKLTDLFSLKIPVGLWS